MKKNEIAKEITIKCCNKMEVVALINDLNDQLESHEEPFVRLDWLSAYILVTHKGLTVKVLFSKECLIIPKLSI